MTDIVAEGFNLGGLGDLRFRNWLNMIESSKWNNVISYNFLPCTRLSRLHKCFYNLDANILFFLCMKQATSPFELRY